ncbi:hypothetical protein ACH9EU_12845 [Kocuria sp. M1R5S2]
MGFGQHFLHQGVEDEPVQAPAFGLTTVMAGGGPGDPARRAR